MRVATRRLRSVLNTAAPILDLAWVDRDAERARLARRGAGPGARPRRAHPVSARGGRAPGSGRPQGAGAALQEAQQIRAPRSERRSQGVAERALPRAAGLDRSRRRGAAAGRSRLAAGRGQERVQEAAEGDATGGGGADRRGDPPGAHQGQARPLRDRAARGRARQARREAARRSEGVPGRRRRARTTPSSPRLGSGRCCAAVGAQRTALAAGILVSRQRDHRDAAARGASEGMAPLRGAAGKVWA